ncbi:hypothetical protein Q3G72_011061 [Acer saccharum]|nr:hypothetical protein Q3G72_011061 [Acer saccharum]
MASTITTATVLREEEIQSLNNSSIQADVSSNEVVEDVSSWGEDDIRDTNKFLEWADELYQKEMGKLRIWRDSFTKPDPNMSVLERGLLRLLGGWRSRELERRFRTLFARKIELELSRSSSSLDRDDYISLVLEIQELISLLTGVLVDLLNSSSSQTTPCA